MPTPGLVLAPARLRASPPLPNLSRCSFREGRAGVPIVCRSSGVICFLSWRSWPTRCVDRRSIRRMKQAAQSEVGGVFGGESAQWVAGRAEMGGTSAAMSGEHAAERKAETNQPNLKRTTTMKKDTTTPVALSTKPLATSVRIRSGVKAGGLYTNHNATQLRIKSGVKAGGMKQNHSEGQLRIMSGVKAGANLVNHNETLLVVR